MTTEHDIAFVRLSYRVPAHEAQLHDKKFACGHEQRLQLDVS